MKNYLKTVAIALTTISLVVSCNKDDNGDVNMGTESYDTSFKMTDAPIDNANECTRMLCRDGQW